MSFQTTASIVLALALLMGCGPAEQGYGGDPPSREPEVKTLRAKVALKAGKIDIDYDVHDSALVHPGDYVEWVCDCDPRIQFSVESPRQLADVDALTEMQLDTAWNREAVQALAERFVEMPPSSGREGEPATSALQEWPGQAADPISAAREFLEAIAPVLPAEKGPELFQRPLPSQFVDSGRPIRSHPVASDLGTGVWKFSWKFRLKDKPTEEVVWDPHLYIEDY